ncbi:hypothetical protein IC582_008231 [Cucumis melo]
MCQPTPHIEESCGRLTLPLRSLHYLTVLGDLQILMFSNVSLSSHVGATNDEQGC